MTVLVDVEEDRVDDDDRDWATCDECGGAGEVVDCCDDLCVGAGRCMHGDGTTLCRACDGEGEVLVRRGPLP